MDILKSALKFCISLFLAVQIWVWLRLLGSLWISDNLNLADTFFLSVYPLKFSLYSFAVAIIPAYLLYHFFHGRIPSKYMLLIYCAGGLVLVNIYIVSVSGLMIFNLNWIAIQGGMIMLSGVAGGAVFFGLIDSVLIGKGYQVKVTSSLDPTRRRVISGIAVVFGSLGFAGSITGPVRILKNSSKFVDLDLSPMVEGEYIAVEINKTPVWIVKRTQAHIDELIKQNHRLFDPESLNSKQPENTRNAYRSIKPEYFVVEAICTHLGCLPEYMPNGPSEGDTKHNIKAPQLFCPCHGGIFDLAGRVYSNTPPPSNLSIPEHEFIADHIVRIYYPSLKYMWLG